MHIKIENQLNTSNLSSFPQKEIITHSSHSVKAINVCLWQTEAYCDFIYILNINSFKNVFVLLLFMHFIL